MIPIRPSRMSDRQAVRAELERKRIQLAQMRQERERRSRMAQESEQSSQQQQQQQNLDNRGEKLDDADAVLQALGISASLSRASTAPSNMSNMDQSRLTNAPSPDSNSQSTTNQQAAQQNLTHSLNDSFPGMINSTPRTSVPLEIVHVNQINIAPKETVSYTKSTQTPAPLAVPPQGSATDQTAPHGDAPQQKSYYGKQTNSNAINPPSSHHHQQQQQKSLRTSSTTTATTTTTTNGEITHTAPGSSTPNSLSNSTTPAVAGATVNQLALEWDDEFPVLTYDEDEEPSSDFNNIPNGRQSKSTATGTGPQSTSMPQVEMVRPADGQADENGMARKDQPQSEPLEIKDLSEDERRQIETREDYQKFIERATKILERALHHNESPEIFIQYFPEGGQGTVDSDRKSGNRLSLNRIFYDEKWSRNRCVTGFDWSAQYPELLLASYYTNEQAPSDPDGTLLVWNTKFKNTSPEYIFHCQSPIMSCCFAKFHPSLIVGGTYSGQIVLWDMRSNKKTPVQRSPLTAAVHTHPVYCAKVVGTQNAHNLISISTDGKLCSWSLDMLSAPQETMELNQQKQTRSVAVTCMSFHPDDYNNFLVGSEEGTVYSACRHGSKTGILSSFEGHQGLVTSVDYRPIETQGGHSHLFLTSSIDWTVKLWDSKESEPIHSFESNGDYIYDVKWSPNNPALFATADGDGRVDIWNLANDSELPTASTHIELVSTGDSRIQPSLNKLIWAPSGDQIIVGDDVGRIHVYDVGDVGDLGGAAVRQEDNWKLGDMTGVNI